MEIIAPWKKDDGTFAKINTYREVEMCFEEINRKKISPLKTLDHLKSGDVLLVLDENHFEDYEPIKVHGRLVKFSHDPMAHRNLFTELYLNSFKINKSILRIKRGYFAQGVYDFGEKLSFRYLRINNPDVNRKEKLEGEIGYDGGSLVFDLDKSKFYNVLSIREIKEREFQ